MFSAKTALRRSLPHVTLLQNRAARCRAVPAGRIANAAIDNAAMQKTVTALFAAVAIVLAFAPNDGAREQKGVPVEVVKELAPTGKLRAAINLGNAVLAQKDRRPASRRASRVDLARELGKRLGVPVELVPFDAAGKVFAAMAKSELDIAFFAIEPVRAAEVDFTAPYVLIEGAYMVPKDSPLKTPADVDRAGIRIGVGQGSAYDLYLTRTIKNATIVRAKVGGGAGIDRPVLSREARGRGRRAPAARRICQDQSERARDGPALHGDPAGHGHAARAARRRRAICAASSRR